MSRVICFVLLGALYFTVLAELNAQSSNHDNRDVNSAGPFPIYITLQYCASGAFSDFRGISRSFDSRNVKSTLWGPEISLGTALGLKYIGVLYFELSYRNLHRRLHESKDGNGTNDLSELLFKNETLSFRAGTRIISTYIVTVNAEVGPVLFRQLTTRAELNQTLTPPPELPGTIRAYYEDHLRPRKFYFPGYELKVRVNILDPVGTSGGAGVFLEAYKAWYLDNYPVGLIVDNQTISSDQQMTSFAIGIIAPIAYRIKEKPKPKQLIKKINIKRKKLYY